ncbi:MAG TPA: hypothetical protein VIG44_05115, partial [Thermomicrobiales bacterium]
DRPPRGEYVIIITEAPVVADIVDDETIDALLRTLLESGSPPAAAAKAVAAQTGSDRGVCYSRAVAVKRRMAS